MKTIRWGVRLGAVLLFALLTIGAFAGCELTAGGETPSGEATAPETTAAAPAAVTEPAGYDAAAPIRTESGATVTTVPSTGLQFTGHVNRQYLNALYAAYGADRVKVGMLFTATENLTANQIPFTARALDRCDAVTGQKYVRVTAESLLRESDEFTFRCVLPDIAEADYGKTFSAVAFVEADGFILRYAVYAEANNARSVKNAAEEMLFDLSDTETGAYRNAVQTYGQTKYSAYTPAQREQLLGFCTLEAAPVRTVSGATISLSSPTGMRFLGQISRRYLDLLYATYGADRVKVGLLFTPTENLTANRLAFTVEALDNCAAVAEPKYVKEELSVTLNASDNTYRVAHVLPIEKADYGRAYSFATYVELDGQILRYSAYSQASDSRSLADLAETELYDLNSSKTSKYQYTLCAFDKTKYSPYTPAEREQLSQFCYVDAFTVMSYNIAVYDGPKGGKGWEGRNPEKVTETVLSVLPDVIGFQEVNQKGENGWDSYLASLATEGGYTRLTGNYCAYDFEKNEIFFKTSKFTLKTEGTLSFKTAATLLGVANTESANNKLDNVDRIFHYAVLQSKSSGRKILVVNTHLHYGGTGSGHEEDDKVRRYEIRTLLAWLETQKANYPDQIVLGDMNSHYKGSGQGAVNMRVFTDGGFKMSRTEAKIKGDVGGTLAEQNRTTRPQWIFDYILTKGNVGAAYFTVVNNPIDTGSTYPADHIPVLAHLYLK